MSSSSGERERETEGHTVTLLCSSTCTIHHLELTWFRDDHALKESGPALHLGPLTTQDSGNYSCALKSNLRSRSAAYLLQVEAAHTGECLSHALLPVSTSSVSQPPSVTVTALTIARLVLIAVLTVLIVTATVIVLKR